MKSSKMKFSIASLVLLSSISVQANIITTDLIKDDGMIAFDTDTGKEWLKLNATKGLSIAGVKVMLKEGGKYEGFRLPTEEEIEEYLSNAYNYFVKDVAGVELVDNPIDSTPLSQKIYGQSGYGTTEEQRAGQDLTGMLGKSNSIGYSYGYYVGRNGSIEWSGFNSSNGDLEYRQDYNKNKYNSDIYESWKDDNFSVFLISDGGYTHSSLNDDYVISIQSEASSVPLTSTAIIFLSGLVFTRRN